MYAIRLKSVLVLLGIGVALLIGTLFELQVIEGARFHDEAQQRLRRAPGFYPTVRGSILDRNGVVIAQDTGAFDLAIYFPFVDMDDEFVASRARKWKVTPAEVRGRVGRMWSELARLTKIPPDELERRRQTIIAKVTNIREVVRNLHGWPVPVREETFEERPSGETMSVPHPLVSDVSLEIVSVIKARADEFPGLVLVQTHKREYLQGSAAPHVVGRLGEVTPEELADGGLNAPYGATDLRRYWPGDSVGRGGVEQSCEGLLRGARGFYQKGLKGDILEDLPPAPGKDIHLTLDIALQADVEAILDHPPAESGVAKVTGAAVVLDCRTGEVLAAASGPRYDSATFSADYAELLRDPRGPLVNRAVAGLYPMGSTFKAVTATAGLHEGAITAGTVIACNGILHAESPNRFRCHVFLSRGYGHGDMDLREAIKKSCNIYFYTVAERLGLRGGVGPDLNLARERLEGWASKFGLGESTGLGLPGESAGRVDVRDPRNLAVGQGELMATPVQVAQIYGLVATDGRMPPLSLVRELAPADRARPGLSLNPRHMAAIRDGFYAVVNEAGGTGYGNANLDDIRIDGKTGTAQAGHGEDHAWFTGYAPGESPRIAFAVIVEHGGHGGAAAGPIGRAIVKACQAHGYLDDRKAAPEPGLGAQPAKKNGSGLQPALPRPASGPAVPRGQPVG